MNGRDVIKLLEKAGFQVVRVQGSHHILAKDGHPRSVPVPAHGHHDLARGLIAAIERQSGVKLT